MEAASKEVNVKKAIVLSEFCHYHHYDVYAYYAYLHIAIHYWFKFLISLSLYLIAIIPFIFAFRLAAPVTRLEDFFHITILDCEEKISSGLSKFIHSFMLANLAMIRGKIISFRSRMKSSPG